MEATEAERAVTAAMSVAAALELDVDDAEILHNSNRVVARLMPCDTVARVSPVGWYSSTREVEVVRRLTEEGDSPVAGLDPRVDARVVAYEGFEIAMWVYFPQSGCQQLLPGEYADTLERLHGGLRRITHDAPHFTDRFTEIQQWLVDGHATPDLGAEDRELLLDRLQISQQLQTGGGSAEQLLHGEPHPWNLLTTDAGLLFIDFENCARGPIEYDLAWVPHEVSERYLGADQELVAEFRRLVLALVAAHRWNQDDHHPSGRQSGVAFLDALRAGPPWPALDDVQW